MKLTDHILASPAMIALAPVMTMAHIGVAMVASVFIDSDHVHLVLKEKAYTRAGIKRLNDNIYKKTINGKPNRMYVEIVYLFHTVEFNLVLFALSFMYPILLPIWAGFVFHIICDIVHHSSHQLPIIRWLFLTDWILGYALSKK